MERIEGLVAEGLALKAADRTGMSFADGPALKREWDRWDARTRTAPGASDVDLTAADEAAVAYIIAGWGRSLPAEVS